jgi:hypothetical protein
MPDLFAGICHGLSQPDCYLIAKKGLRSGARPYDVSPDGRRFVMIGPIEGPSQPTLTFVENWVEPLQWVRLTSSLQANR